MYINLRRGAALFVSAAVIFLHSASGATIYSSKTISTIGSSSDGDTSQVTVTMWAKGKYDTVFIRDTVYDTTRVPIDVLLAIDLSNSMNTLDGTAHWRILWAKVAALGFLDSLKTGDRVAVYGWTSSAAGTTLADTANKARYYQKFLDFTTDFAEARAFILDSIYLSGARLTDTCRGQTILIRNTMAGGTFGDTPLHIASMLSSNRLAIAGRPGAGRAVIMLTDGANRDVVPLSTTTALIDSLNAAQGQKFFTIGFIQGDTAELHALANAGKGGFYNATISSQLDSIYAALAGILVESKIDSTIIIKQLQVTQDTILPGVDAALLFDNSISMLQEISAAKQAGRDFVGMLGDSDRVAMFSFARWNLYDTIAEFTPYSQFNTALTAMDQSLNASQSSTAVWYATLKAMQYTLANARNGSLPALVVLTDGQDNNSGAGGANMGATSNAAFDSLMRYLIPFGSSVPVFTISLGNLTNADQLQAIAQSTGGKYYLASTGSELSAIYKDIAEVIINNIGARKIRIVENLPPAYTYITGSQAAGPSNKAPLDSMYAVTQTYGTTLVWTAPILSVWDTIQGTYRLFVPKADSGDNLNQTLVTTITFQDNDYHDSMIVFGGAPPTAPALATPGDYAANVALSPTLVWRRVNTAQTYNVMVSQYADFSVPLVDTSGISDTSCTVNVTLSNVTKYYWRVNASNTFGTSAWSGVRNFTTMAAPPGVPVLRLPANGSTNTVSNPALSWIAGLGGTPSSYRVQVSVDPAFAALFSDTTLSGFLTTCQVSGLAGSTTYYWRVNAANPAATSAWSEARYFTTRPRLPDVPALVSPLDASVNQPVTGLVLSWNQAVGAATYQAQVSTAGDFSSVIYDTAVAAPAGSLMLVMMPYQTTCYWRVNATNPGGTSAWSEVRSFTTVAQPAGAPVLVSPADGSVDQPVSLGLKWNAAAGAIACRVQMSTKRDFSSIYRDTSVAATADSLTVGGMDNLTTYYWRVSTVKPGDTAWSGAWNFTTIVALPRAPLLVSPANGAVNLGLNQTLTWVARTGGAPSLYQVQVDTQPTFVSTVFDTTVSASTTSLVKNGLSTRTTYYWRVKAINAAAGVWSEVWSFTTFKNLRVPISAGWNMISLNVHPVDSSAGTVLGTLSAKTFVLAKNDQGEVFCPSLLIDDIGVFRTGKGYQVYSGAADTIQVDGTGVNVSSTPLLLPSGWSIIGYLPQSDMPVVTALAGITGQMLLVKNNAGQVYLPGYFIDDIGTMKVGAGYQIFMKSAAALTYPSGSVPMAKTVAAHEMITLPVPRHYVLTLCTGNNASIVASGVTLHGKTAEDSSEIGAFDSRGQLVGAGGVLHGLAAVTVWGDDPRSKEKDGCAPSETITFRLWDGKKEYPLEYNGKAEPQRYSADGILSGTFSVPEGFFINAFALSIAGPNPIGRGRSLKIEFDVPMTTGTLDHAVEINIFNLRGDLVTRLTRGNYKAGHYSITWNGASGHEGVICSNVYIVQMRARNFNRKMKVILIR